MDPEPAAPYRFRWPLHCLALFLLVVGARFCLIRNYALPLPFWDQWDGEGLVTLKPWLEGHLGFGALFTPHNEHRIFLTRVLAVALTAMNHQWDNHLEAAVNAVGCGVSAVLIAQGLASALGAAFRRRVLCATALCFVLPFGWENTLVGFQSQNYFLILFSLAAVWGLGTRRSGSAGWWAGWLGSVLACLSMASGFLAAVAVLGVRGVRMIRERRRPGPDDLVTGAWCLAVAVVGWWTRTEVPAHAILKAESPMRFVVALGRFLAWPLCSWPVLGLLILVPLGLLLVAYWRRRGPLPGTELLLGAGGWAVLQCVALAYGRGGQGAFPASRYMDLLAVVPLVSFFAWQVLIAQSTSRRGLLKTGAAFWLLLLGWGLWTETVEDFTEGMPEYAQKWRRGEENLRGYVATGDFDRFLAHKPKDDLPHPNPRVLAAVLDDPALRAILPADVRPALVPETITAAPAFGPGNVDPACDGLPTGMQTWGSFTSQGAAAQGALHARFTSPNRLPYLCVYFSGYLGEPGLRFALGSDGHALREHRPLRLPREHWREEYLRRPGPGFSVLAEDRSATRWFGFSAPVEVGFWSRWTGFLLRRGGGIAALGALLWAGLELTAAPRALAAFRRRYAAGQTLPDAAGSAPLGLLSVVIPARDEAGCIAATIETLHAELGQNGIAHEIIVVDDGSGDDTWRILGALAASVPALRPVQNLGRHGFGRAIVYGLDRMRGDAAVVMMADASDSPADVVRYWRTLSEGYDCVFGSRFEPGGRVHGYPWFKLTVNRLANLFIRELFRVPLNDTTNAFKAYRREVIEGCRPLISSHFNLTVELPLKAVVRGFSWTVVPISWRNRKTGAAKFRLKEMGSRYLFICLYLWLEKHLSRGDYRRRG